MYQNQSQQNLHNEDKKMKMRTHMVVMIVGFIALLIVSKLIGISAIPLFFFLCFFMMAAMMLGMSHGDMSDKK